MKQFFASYRITESVETGPFNSKSEAIKSLIDTVDQNSHSQSLIIKIAILRNSRIVEVDSETESRAEIDWFKEDQDHQMEVRKHNKGNAA